MSDANYNVVRLFATVEAGGMGLSKEKKLFLSVGGPIINTSDFILASKAPVIAVYPDLTLHISKNNSILKNVEKHKRDNDSVWLSLSGRVNKVGYEHSSRLYKISLNCKNNTGVSLEAIAKLLVNENEGERYECHDVDLLL